MENYQTREQDKRIYEKPTMVKEETMTFPYNMINEQNGRKIICRQCSGCHGCR